VKIATWNVNSLNVRLPRLIGWLAAEAPDVLGLHETKLDDAKFPRQKLADAGYEAYCSGQRTYNGVALLVRDGIGAATDVLTSLPGLADEQKRVIAASIAGMRVVCVYVPNGQAIDSDKYRYKLAWCHAATAFLKSELALHPALALAGDFNIAPEDRDVHDPELWRGQVLCSDPERRAFADWIALGLRDGFRLFDQPAMTFSWWDYRQLAFPESRLRIDHILLSGALAAIVGVDRSQRAKASDHAPIAELAVCAARNSHRSGIVRVNRR
jgi:exodeoxyribonuclease-3